MKPDARLEVVEVAAGEPFPLDWTEQVVSVLDAGRRSGGNPAPIFKVLVLRRT